MLNLKFLSTISNQSLESNMIKTENLVEFKIIDLNNQNAVLSLIENNNIQLNWPLSKLPQDLKTGDNISFKILTNTDLEEEHNAIARKLLEEMIN